VKIFLSMNIPETVEDRKYEGEVQGNGRGRDLPSDDLHKWLARRRGGCSVCASA